MSDLIDRAEAQTELQFATRRYTVAHEAHGEGRVVWSDDLICLTDAMNALRKLPSAQSEPEWIPVSKRLPDVDFPGEIKVMGYDGKTECINADYLISKPVAAKGKDGKPIIAIYEVDDDKRKYWVNDADGTITDGITEWAPLPESYK